MDLSELSYLAPLVVVPLVLRWLMAGKQSEAQPEGGAFVMRYGRAWRAMVWGGAVVTGAVGLLPLLVPVKPDEWWLYPAMVGGFAALTLLLGLEVYRLCFRLSEAGIERHSPWRRAPRLLRWEELANVSYLPSSQSVELRHRDGWCLNVSQYLQGFATLQAYVERHARPGALGPVARGQLQALR